MPTNSAGRNHKRTKESSLFGTRKLAFYTLYASTDHNMVGNVQQGYSFRVNTTTGAVTFDATITARSIDNMNLEWSGNDDENTREQFSPFNYNFLGQELSSFFINSNGGVNFSTADSAFYANSGGTVGSGSVFIANNDACMTSIYSELTGDPGLRKLRVKVRGNTDYQNDFVVNTVYEFIIDEDNLGYIEFLVTQQPSDPAAYASNTAYWGVSDGSGWIDGLSTHTQPFAPFNVGSEELWKLPNSPYYKAVQAIQNAGAEIYWLGTPHNVLEQFTVDWSGLFLATNADAFMFAIADDASNPSVSLDQTPSYTAVSTGTEIDHNWIAFDSSASTSGPTNQGIYIGQPVVFSGTTFGGIVAGKKYYVANYANYGDPAKFAITVSETVKSEVLDITYPEGVGGDPGLEVVLDIATGSMTATFYNYDIEWQGTAGDQASSCCFNLTAPGISPVRLVTAVNQSGAFTGDGYFWIERANPSYGIFPAWWTYTATL